MERAELRIEVYYTINDARGDAIMRKLRRLNYGVDRVCITDNYLIHGSFTPDEGRSIGRILIQPVTQGFTLNEPWEPGDFDFALEIGYLPGVTDNVAHTVRESIEDRLARKLDPEKSVFTTTTYFLGGSLAGEEAARIALELYNPLIQRMKLLTRREYGRGAAWAASFRWSASTKRWTRTR
jgi:phosphoribosylformylglycinamidine synthase subunit PurSL